MLSVNHLSGLNRPRECAAVCTPSWHGISNIIPPQAQKEKRGVIFKRAESYVKEYRDAEREKIRLSRLAKQEGNFYVPGEPKLVFVVRIKG